MEIKAGADDNNRRLDLILRKCFPELPLSGVHRLLRKGKIRLNNRKASAGDRVLTGDVIAAPDNLSFLCKPASSCMENAKKIDVIFENTDLLVLNKPSGLPVHGAEESLDSYARAYLKGKIPPSLSFKPGPLHRLDQPTSGLIVFSKSLAGARFFSALMRERLMVKKYHALLDGRISGAEVWENTLIRDKNARKTFLETAQKEKNGKKAMTRVIPLAVNAAYSLVCAEIATGRTHQIRAQAAFYGHPLAGDRKYGGSTAEHGLLLHAESLIFPQEMKIPPLNAPLPALFRAKIAQLFPEFSAASNIF
jgi:23S rRNA pseudouridine955/2504/2580 synthase